MILIWNFPRLLGVFNTKSCPKVVFIKDGKEVEIETNDIGKSLLQIATDNGVEMDSACGGNGICTTCMVQVQEGKANLGEVTEREEIMGMDSEEMDLRLGCQCELSGDCKVELAY